MELRVLLKNIVLGNSYEERLLDIFKVNRFNHATQSIWLKVTNNDENLMHCANGKIFLLLFYADCR